MFDESIRRACTITGCVVAVIYAVVAGICAYQGYHFELEVAGAVARGLPAPAPVEGPDLTTLIYLLGILFAPSGLTKGVPQLGGVAGKAFSVGGAAIAAHRAARGPGDAEQPAVEAEGAGKA